MTNKTEINVDEKRHKIYSVLSKESIGESSSYLFFILKDNEVKLARVDKELRDQLVSGYKNELDNLKFNDEETEIEEFKVMEPDNKIGTLSHIELDKLKLLNLKDKIRVQNLINWLSEGTDKIKHEPENSFALLNDTDFEKIDFVCFYLNINNTKLMVFSKFDKTINSSYSRSIKARFIDKKMMLSGKEKSIALISKITFIILDGIHLFIFDDHVFIRILNLVNLYKKSKEQLFMELKEKDKIGYEIANLSDIENQCSGLLDYIKMQTIYEKGLFKTEFKKIVEVNERFNTFPETKKYKLKIDEKKKEITFPNKLSFFRIYRREYATDAIDDSEIIAPSSKRLTH